MWKKLKTKLHLFLINRIGESWLINLIFKNRQGDSFEVRSEPEYSVMEAAYNNDVPGILAQWKVIAQLQISTDRQTDSQRQYHFGKGRGVKSKCQMGLFCQADALDQK